MKARVVQTFHDGIEAAKSDTSEPVAHEMGCYGHDDAPQDDEVRGAKRDQTFHGEPSPAY